MKAISKITVVDIMVVIAILMILSAIILPHFAEKYTRVHRASHTHTTSVLHTAS